jgi:hypothetical protein
VIRKPAGLKPRRGKQFSMDVFKQPPEKIRPKYNLIINIIISIEYK